MIYSVTQFFNEKKLLDLRVKEERDYVDKFIVCQSTRTFTNIPKPVVDLSYNTINFKHIVLDDFVANDAWKNERSQRNNTLRDEIIKDDDIILCTDLDEIINGIDIPSIIEAAREYEYVHLEMYMYYYKINLYLGKWNKGFACTGKAYKKSNDLSSIRELQGKDIVTNGRHFSFLMDAKSVSEKIHAFAHTEFDKSEFTDITRIENRMKNYIDPFDRNKTLTKVPLDFTYPKTIINNPEEWTAYVA